MISSSTSSGFREKDANLSNLWKKRVVCAVSSFRQKESKETRGRFRPRAWGQPPENTMRFVWTLPVSSRCCWKKTWAANVTARSPRSPGTGTTLTQPRRCEPGGGGFVSCHTLSPWTLQAISLSKGRGIPTDPHTKVRGWKAEKWLVADSRACPSTSILVTIAGTNHPLAQGLWWQR